MLLLIILSLIGWSATLLIFVWHLWIAPARDEDIEGFLPVESKSTRPCRVRFQGRQSKTSKPETKLSTSLMRGK
jgi:hypothetical protein